MYLLGAYIVLLSSTLATVASAHTCRGDLCDKGLHEIHIMMTHNSLSFKRGIGRCQTHGLVKQFQNGVRGFNFDLYECPDTSGPPNQGGGGFTCGTLWHTHGPAQAYDPTAEIRALVNELNEDKWRNEVIVVQLQSSLPDKELNFFKGLFGDLIMDETYAWKDAELKVPIELNKRVYLDAQTSSGSGIIGENDYSWKKCKKKDMPVTCRRGTTCDRGSVIRPTNPFDDDDAWDPRVHYPLLLMNSFCSGATGLRRKAKYTNKKCRLLENAVRFESSGNFQGAHLYDDDDTTDYEDDGYPNILMVDFYEEGDVQGALDCLNGGYNARCLSNPDC